jgi:hypothetical protein
MAYRPPHGVPKVFVLSDVEIAALRNVAHHQVVEPPSCQRLERLGLIEQKLDSWILTLQGKIRLMFIDAR